mmetsp:Transcript_40768/g.100175  ORF Transcript_40768/g.100175 Transcript_40768/m.100175 type:complete len:250 (-) Transcript_40768:504-1253(-)
MRCVRRPYPHAASHAASLEGALSGISWILRIFSPRIGATLGRHSCRNLRTSRTTVSLMSCPIPSYSVILACIPMFLQFSCAFLPRVMGTMRSEVPWQKRVGSPSSALICSLGGSSVVGNHVHSPTKAPTRIPRSKRIDMAMHPPWLYPMTAIRSRGIPLRTSDSIRFRTYRALASLSSRVPSSLLNGPTTATPEISSCMPSQTRISPPKTLLATLPTSEAWSGSTDTACRPREKGSRAAQLWKSCPGRE